MDRILVSLMADYASICIVNAARKDAPLFLEPKAQPDFGENETVAKLQGIEIVRRWDTTIRPNNSK